MTSIRTREIDCGGWQVSVSEAGQGDPLMLIHGGGPGATGLSNYHRNIGELSQHYRLLVPDLPGFGASSKPAITTPRFQAYGDTLLALLDALDIDRCHLVGNSLGGGTALKMALEYPDRIGKLVLMGPAGLASASCPFPTEGIRRIFGYYADEGPSREKLAALIRLMVHDPDLVTKELIEERYLASTLPDVLESPPFVTGAPVLLEELWRDTRLTGLPHEVLVIWGRDDQVMPLGCAAILINQLPHARMVTFNRCGHWVQWERAAEFNRYIRCFLSE